MTENADGGAGATETIDQIHDAHLAAFDAFQADPSKPELKEAATKAAEKWKTSFAADKKASEEAAASGKPPEKYDLKPPQDSKLEPKDVDAIAEFAKANKLPANVAQAILERTSADREAYVEGLRNQVQEEQKQWLDEIVKDPEIGGDAEKAAKTAELVKRVHAKFAPPEFAKIMDETGYGNNPGYVKMIARILKAANFKEDTLVVNGTPPGPPPKDPAKAMYPNMAKALGRE